MRGSDREEQVDGFSLDAADEAASICIAGPDGTGKSVLALHFGSRYAADSIQYCRTNGLDDPLFFYVSSDLSFTKAESMWKGFALDRPNSRLVPFRIDDRQTDWSGKPADDKYDLQMMQHAPAELEKLAQYLKARKHQLAFIDLAANTAGDDWAFLLRVIASMPIPHESAPRHMVIIDAMEGFEAFGGDVDAFGEKTTRRGRVAKLMRLAARKCHLVVVIEEPASHEPLAEQFVADVVVRLRVTESHGYSRREIEIEKARGQLHVRGRHPYAIRDGRGSTTGMQTNFDDPTVLSAAGGFQSYLDVFPSLDSLSSAVIRSKGLGRVAQSYLRAGFGIRELDEMLAVESAPRTRRELPDGHDKQGLPCGAVTALIGDANTQKSFLGLAFLGHHFFDLALRAVKLDKNEASHPGDAQASHYYRRHFSRGFRFSLWGSRIGALGRTAGAVVLVTTKDETSRTLADRFIDQAEEETCAHARSQEELRAFKAKWKDRGFREALRAYIESRTICRRLEVRDLPSAILFHEIRRSIEAARQIVIKQHADVYSEWPEPVPNERARNGWRVRFVLDDFNSITRTYGRVHEDALFLPFLLLHLRREGLSSLIIETRAGNYGMPTPDIGPESKSDLGALSDHRLYTWHVKDFFGDHRIAIAAIPPLVQRDAKSPVLVRELEWSQPSDQARPRVNPRFELYAGLDTDHPTIVPLCVRLYAETSAWEQYIQGLDDVWARIFDSPRTDNDTGKRSVVYGETSDSYDAMRKACEPHASTNLDYSLIVQIDEFWNQSERFRPQERYLKSAPESPAGAGERRSAYDGVYGLSVSRDGMPEVIPFGFDFGFLACRERAWNEATRSEKLSNAEMEAGRENAVAVWLRMRTGEPYTWLEFLKAASHVAKWDSAQQAQPVPVFDIAMLAPETFSCLILEMWLSQIVAKRPALERRLAILMSLRTWNKRRDEEWSLPNLVRKYRDELYQVWLLLVECLDLGSFGTRKEGFGFEFGRNANPKAVASRQWYKTASLIASEHDDVEKMRFCRLPGSFSVRGDWFLAAVRGSRSDRLVDSALDLLSSREANIERLIRGLALPTLRIKQKANLSSRLHGWYGESTQPKTLSYADVLSLGRPLANFHWLWRGNLTNYHVTAAIWERWLYRVLRRWKRTRESFGSGWISGFKVYDDVENRRFAKLRKETVSYENFKSMCEKLCGELAEVEDSRKVPGRAGGI